MINLEQIQNDLDNGVIVSRVTLVELVKYAAHLKVQRDALVEKCADMTPRFCYDSNGPDYHECPCCGASATVKYVGGRAEATGDIIHDADCPHKMALDIKAEEG